MKKIFLKIIIMTFIAGIFNSCNDELDQIPFDGLATENAYITASDFDNAIRGAYLGLVTLTQLDEDENVEFLASYYGGSFLSISDVLSDNVILTQRGRKTKRIFHEWTYNANRSYRQLYQDTYSVISRANFILDKLETFDGANKNNIKGEALALRALAHFDLVRTFAKIPTQSSDANASLGIIYKTDIDPLLIFPRESVGNIYQKIVTDLELSLTLINSTNPDSRMGKEAVSLILSRAHLYMGNWQDAINATSNISTPVSPRDSFVDVWDDSSSSGLIFSIKNEVGGLDIDLGVQWSQGSATNLIPEYVPTFSFNALFGSDDNDIRKVAYIFDASNGALNFNGIKKVIGRGDAFNGLVDIKILRAAEVHLNKAEAYFELGQETQALSSLDVVRSNRYLTFTGGESGQALKDAIRLERRLEFAFEYQRFFDLKRWGLGISRGTEGEFVDGSGTPSEALNLPAGDHKFQLPLDQSSLVVNPLLQQNPGY